MSNALDIYYQHRIEQIENGQFSEEFVLDPSGAANTFRGIYDEEYFTHERDQGNVRQQTRRPRILVSTIPTGAEKNVKITVRSEERTIQKIDLDPEGVPRIWII